MAREDDGTATQRRAPMSVMANRRISLSYFGAEPAVALSLAEAAPADVTATVSVASTADAAVATVRGTDPDCLVVDVPLAEGTPAAIAARLEELAAAPPVVGRRVGPATDAAGLVDAWLPAEADPAESWRRIDAALAAAGDCDERAAVAGATPPMIQRFLDNLRDVFFVFDADRNFRLWNDRFTEVTGYDDAAIASTDPLELVAPPDREAVREAIATVFETGAGTAQFDLLRRDGESVPYSVTGSLVADGDRGPFVAGIGRDVTARAAREREVTRERDLTRRIIETSPVGIAVLDGDGSILRANERAEEMLDLAPAGGDASGDREWALFDEAGDEIGLDEHPVARVLATGEPVFGYRHAVELPDGTEKWLSTNAAPLTDADGRVANVIVAVEDVTELKAHERELTRRTEELDAVVEELRRSNAELEQFAYVASHDLTEPLRMISNYLGLLERRYGDELDEDAREFVAYATEGAQRLRQLVNGLLEYSRTQRGTEPLEPVDTADVLATVESNLHIAIAESDAEVTAGPLPTVAGVEDQLVRLFQNLVSNAIEYAGADPPRIDVTAERDGDVYRFSVTDEGVGIDPDAAERVFDIFYSDDRDSTGIGLAICQKVVENHGGRIWVDSEPGAGTTVSFTLPAADADRPANRRDSPLRSVGD